MKIYEHLYSDSVDMMTPYLTQIVEQGVEEGIFDNDRPEETVRFWLNGLRFIRDDGDFFREDPMENMKALGFITERLLGAKKSFLRSFFEVREDEIESLVRESMR